MSEPSNTSIKRPRIMVLASFCPSLLNFRREMLEAFVDQGCEVHAGGPEMSADVRRELAAMGCLPFEVPMQRNGQNPLKDIACYWHLVRLFLRVKPDIFFGYTIKPVIYGNLAAWTAKVPRRCALITGLGNSFGAPGKGVAGLLKTIARKMYRSAIRKTHLVLFQNGDDLRLFEEQKFVNGQETGIVNGSGVNLDHYTAQPMPERPVFLLLARLLVEKGIRDFIEAGEIVRQQLPESRFLIAGEFDTGASAISKDEIEDWVRNGKVEYLGSLDDVRPAITEASVYLLPSYYREGTPRTILEAMAMRRPVITCDVPGCREPITDGENGILIPPHSPRDLAAAMVRLGSDRELRKRMGERGRQIAEHRYDVHKVNESIIKFLKIDTFNSG